MAEEQPAQTDITLNQLTYQSMQPLLNTDFEVYEGDSTFVATLVEVEKIVEKKPALHSWQKPKTEEPKMLGSNKRIPFTLVFRFPIEHEIKQGIYHFSHSTTGRLPGIFLTPITEDEDGLYFEAVFT